MIANKLNRSKYRNVNGILLLNKPIGLSSNAALQTVKRLYLAKKAGHTGSLDPLASGMLPICFGEATKFSQFLLDADKHYTVTAKLGIVTTTDDAEGEILEQQPVRNLSYKIIEKVLEKFRGEIKQVPSMYSAIKHQGQPLYKLARQGITIEREARPVTIHQLDLITFNADTLELDVSCSKGTYIRTLVADIGKELECGAHVASLCRESVAGFQKNQMISVPLIEELAQKQDFAALDKLLLPTESALFNYPEIKLTEAMTFYMRQGQAVLVPHSPKEGLVKLLAKDGTFLGVGEILSDGKIGPKRLIQKL